jgi:hypothetical protein
MNLNAEYLQQSDIIPRSGSNRNSSLALALRLASWARKKSAEVNNERKF